MDLIYVQLLKLPLFICAVPAFDFIFSWFLFSLPFAGLPKLPLIFPTGYESGYILSNPWIGYRSEPYA